MRSPSSRRPDRPSAPVDTGPRRSSAARSQRYADGRTAAGSAAGVGAREAAHSDDLITQGHLLRLWRPPLRPGEWRTLGLFAADDDAQLERVLTSMPLRIWRSDEVIPLAPHPNDPGLPATPGSSEFLTTFTIRYPAGTPELVVKDAEVREAQRASELASDGHLLRLWRLPPGGPDALGLWRASDSGQMRSIADSLPLDSWMTTDITPLTPHPSDPVQRS